jgi:protoporphyrinogen oxidase
MKDIAIIGAGFTGLSAALELAEKKYKVTIFEKENQPGGLAGGFKQDNWEHSLEFHYHHFFTNDIFGRKLMEKINFSYKTHSPITSLLINEKKYRFDSPLSLLSFPLLSLWQKIRLAFILMIFKIPSNLNFLLSFFKTRSAYFLIPKLIGDKTFKMLFAPLFKAKFGIHEKEIAAIWFWARINKRTTKLIYPDGGYQAFAQKLLEYLQNLGVKTEFNSTIYEIRKEKNKWILKTQNGEKSFDEILLTVPFPIASRLIPDFSTQQIFQLDSLNLILETRKPILKNEYWLNINDPNYPFLALIQHTNMADNRHYGGNQIAYVGNYLPRTHEFFQKSKEELIDIFMPKIQKINPNFQKNEIINSFLFHGFDAQPVVDMNYESKIPPIDLGKLKTEYEGLYVANMDMVYPWDRGVNYAIELGDKAANIIDSKFEIRNSKQ